jgi:hypothetical protein
MICSLRLFDKVKTAVALRTQPDGKFTEKAPDSMNFVNFARP